MGTVTERATDWLSAFAKAVNAGDVAGATAMFDDAECFWRDLVFFTWNLKTAEGKEDLNGQVSTLFPMN